MVYEAEPDKIPFFKQYFSVLILIANIIVFIWQILDPAEQMHIEYAFVPSEFFAREKLWTLITSMFMHGDIVHIIMNMWFFLIITDNCEHSMGHLLYIFTYFVSGLCGTLLHALSTLIPVWGEYVENIPSLGASGAIFGLMAVYAILYPKNKFNVLSGTGMRNVGAGVFIVIYFIAELTYAIFSILDPLSMGQTAHFAHVGGFLGGAVIASIFKAVKPKYKK
ncbi:MAG: rhomboid family intramembrane serine protease [Promethearchaeota archaeon]